MSHRGMGGRTQGVERSTGAVLEGEKMYPSKSFESKFSFFSLIFPYP